MLQLNMNNRQSGRRRGRNNSNNNRSQSGGRGGVDQANRIDSRARGNAVQMIEKYKNLARDAQLAGDRVQTEYYLQFADHYFRVHSDFRARQEEKAAQNGQERHGRGGEVRGVEDLDGHGDGEPDTESESDRSDERDSRSQGGRDRRDDDDNRGNRQQQGRSRREREQPRAEQEEPRETEASDSEETAEAAPAPKAPRPRRARQHDHGDSGAGIDSSVLPPAIGRNSDAAEPEAEEAAPAPKTRRPRRTLAARSAGVEAAE